MVQPKALMAALLSTGLVSVAPNVILFVFPNYATGEGAHSQLLSLGQAISAGGLLGDVFLHTLPHAAPHMERDNVGLWVMAGFVIFLVADMLMRWADPSHHSHAHHHSQQTHHDSHEDEKDHKNNNTQSAKQTETEQFRILSPKILLNLTGDALHNFTDGLAIGASFSIQDSRFLQEATMLQLMSSRGGLATVSILLHELPHELGDFATLVKAGCSKSQAILLQFVTAGAAMAGAVLGVFCVEGYGGERLLYITAGGFVYLACVTILPEVLEERVSLQFRLAQVACFCCGVAFLYGVALLEHHAGDGHHHGHGHEHHGHGHHHEHDEHHHRQLEHEHGDHHKHEEHHHHPEDHAHHDHHHHQEL
ncbi:Histidine-rich membrane protein KE4 homolog [Seminavis robusta]|uniref:Histidine-rich membrane protein KE4 homolog n=1 Tax=Seminavis robusta TaxID=568900 RepID=A0A9N8DLV9_9STRA|nr:Histidine-rich membrane protein KE4 homolog [Seminavis robusta]|eukprot:Sro156_g070820.1 Histidine-rich membrane protein KE4 homolog (364) ;mRNA; f:51472-52563